MPVSFTLTYDGGLTTQRLIDFYDVAQALAGFQRSLALTTNLVLNGTVITQAPALKGVQIFASPAQDGSWKIVATILGGVFIASQAPQNSVLGHLLTSAYDYVISESLGFHVDFNKTLLEQYEETHKSKLDLKTQPQSKFDAVIEKCDVSIRNMHRPIAWSKTADSAGIACQADREHIPLAARLDSSTYEYMTFTSEDKSPITVVGRVSSYNMNTFKGRIYTKQEWRPIPFELTESARNDSAVSLITRSLAVNAASRRAPGGDITCTAYRNVSSRP